MDNTATVRPACKQEIDTGTDIRPVYLSGDNGTLAPPSIAIFQGRILVE